MPFSQHALAVLGERTHGQRRQLNLAPALRGLGFGQTQLTVQLRQRPSHGPTRAMQQIGSLPAAHRMSSSGWSTRRQIGHPQRNRNPGPKSSHSTDLNLPEFPTGPLPAVLHEWVEAESHATQTPADLAGLLALAVCSATIARRVEVEPRPGWREPANLFAAVLLESGNRKSAVFSDAMKPLRELEIEMIEAARPTIARKQSERRQAERQSQRSEKIAVEKGDAEARLKAGKLAEELAEQAEPVLPRLNVDDATSEKLGIVLAE
jgi:Protein of unknown function (DUF3987)